MPRKKTSKATKKNTDLVVLEKGELRERHKAVLDHFFFTFKRDGAKAYKHVYECSIETARKKWPQLYRKVSKSDYFVKLEAEYRKNLGITFEKQLEDLEEIKQRCMQGTPVMEMDYAAKEMVSTGMWEFDSRGAIQSIQEQNKMLGYYAAEKLKLETTVDNVIHFHIHEPDQPVIIDAEARELDGDTL